MIKDFDQMKEGVDKFVDGIPKVVEILDNKTFLRNFLGEILTIRQIFRTYEHELRSDPSRFEYKGSTNKRWDIALHLSKQVYIDCKCKTGKEWVRFQARDFGTPLYEHNGVILREIQPLEAKRGEPLFYVLVDAAPFFESGDTNFYVLSESKANRFFSKFYNDGKWKGKKRPNDIPDHHSTDFSVRTQDLIEYRDDELRNLDVN